MTADFKKHINLERISEEARSLYEPEQFPGPIIRLEAPLKAAILLFASGKAVITGVKSLTQLDPIVRRIEAIVARS